MKAKIFEIKPFAVHDGDGIRTTVFFKGCPLKCVWCHNPEGIDKGNQTAYYESKCVSCGECMSLCDANVFTEKGHIFNRERCIGCTRCKDICLSGALLPYGYDVTVEELLPKLLADRDFYENSGGGVTLSGGECLCQADFCALLLKSLKEQGINTAVDTCGFVPTSAIDAVLPFTDVFLYDIKAFNSEVHKKCTGVPNEKIIENLKYIDSKNKAIEVRIPFVPGFNDGEIEDIAGLLSTLKNLTKVRVLPYHNYAGSKYQSLGMENTLPESLPTKEQLDNAKSIIREKGILVMD